MFATTDMPSARHVHVIARLSDGSEREVALGKTYQDALERARGLPSEARLQDAAESAFRALAAAPGIDFPAPPRALRVEVWGEQQGREVHRMACGVGEMRNATGTSLSVGTQLLARRQLTTTEGGVYGPEGCLEPRAFLAAMREKGIAAFADLAMTRPLA